MGHVTEAYPGWVPGPNPFGNQRADSTQTWYRDFGARHLEIRLNFMTGLWQINEARKNSKGTLVTSSWGAFRQSTTTEFAAPEAAMLWFELNKGDL